ncbi:MAG: AEC family transporter [Lachnospiraceae bacterium]
MLILQQMLVLFFVMLVGFFMQKKGILNDDMSQKISWMVVNIANPAMILSSVSGDNQIESQELIITIIISLSMFLSLMILAIWIPMLFNVKRTQYGVYRVMTVFSNIGFMGFPIISALYGKEALFYASLFVLPYNILIYTYGILCLSSKTENKKIESKKANLLIDSLKKIGNIGVLASLAALVLYFGNIRLPEMFSQVFDMFADLTAPLSMMVIGASFGSMSFKDMLTDIRLLIFSIVKLLILPILGMWILTKFIENPMLLGVCLVMLATPVGSMTAMLAQQYECDKDLASRGVALTTLLSVVTIPIVAAVCKLF